MNKNNMTLIERIQFVQSGVADGYLIGQWNIDGDTYLASYKDKSIGFYLSELVDTLLEIKATNA